MVGYQRKAQQQIVFDDIYQFGFFVVIDDYRFITLWETACLFIIPYQPNRNLGADMQIHRLQAALAQYLYIRRNTSIRKSHALRIDTELKVDGDNTGITSERIGKALQSGNIDMRRYAGALVSQFE